MSESVGFSLLPGTANANHAALSGGSPTTSGAPKHANSDVSLTDFNIQSTRRTVEILQAQVQLLSLRVETLEKQNLFLATAFQQLQNQNQIANNSGTLGANAGGAGGSNANNNGGTSPYLSPRPPQHSGNNNANNNNNNNGGLPSLLDSPSAAAKQLEEDLHRMGLNPAGMAALLNSPNQQQALLDGYGGVNPLLAAQQQQLAAAMAQHQREEAIMQMLQGQGSPTTATPTAAFPLGFPVTAGGPPTMPGGGGGNASGANNSTTGTVAVDPNSNMANMAYLYSPTTAHGPPGGSPNAPHPPHANMMLPQHGGSGASVFSMNGAAGGMFGFGGGAGNANGNPGGMAGAMMVAGPGGAPANLSTTVTLDPNKNNSNESLERVCQQPWLKELIMKNCKNISNFTPISKLRNLWKLNLQGCSQHVDDNVVKLISTYNKRLSRLNLCGCEKISNATALQQLSFLFDLNLSGCNIGNDSLEAVANGCQQLSRLAINSCPLVTDISSLRKLKELKLLYCRYSGHISPASIVQVLQEIGSGLLTLNVDGVKFSQLPNLAGPDAATGSSLPQPLALKNLNMKDNTELNALTWLTGLPNAGRYFPQLEMLDVEGCSALTDLGDLAVFPNLKFLRLSKTNISQESLDTVVTKCPAALTIYVDGCPHIKSVEALAKMPTLRKVIVDPALNTAPAAANGLATLYQTNHIEVVFASYNNGNGGNNNNHGGGSGGGGSHHFGGGAGSSITPSGSPTSNFVPAMPSGRS